MKKENGIGMVAVILCIIIIIAVITTIVIIIKGIYKDIDEKNIKANMLLIQGKCKVIQDNSLVKKNQDDYVGTKLSEFKDIDDIGEANNENKDEQEQEQNDEQNSETNSEENKSENENKDENKKEGIIEQFKKIDLLPVSDFDKYYVLTDDDLQKLNLDFKNEEGAYYLINYETSEVIITKSLNGIFKLSEMSTDEQEENNEQSNQEENSTEQTPEEQNNEQEEKSE